jgi:hypothetical protein
MRSRRERGLALVALLVNLALLARLALAYWTQPAVAPYSDAEY